MTTPVTPIYGMPLPSDDIPLADLALIARQQSEAAEAALRRGGIAPPEAQDLATLAGRVTVLETRPPWSSLALQSPWSNYTGSQTPTVGNGPYPGGSAIGYRAMGQAGRFRGWVTNSAAVAAGGRLTGAALPAALRPAGFAQTLWVPAEANDATGTYGRHSRVELSTDGHLYCVRPLAANTFLNFDQATWSLP